MDLLSGDGVVEFQDIGRAGNILHRRGGRGDFREAVRLSHTRDRLPGDGRWMPDGF